MVYIGGVTGGNSRDKWLVINLRQGGEGRCSVWWRRNNERHGEAVGDTAVAVQWVMVPQQLKRNNPVYGSNMVGYGTGDNDGNDRI